MDVGEFWSLSLTAASIAGLVALWGLVTRFAQRRLFGTARSAAIVVAIVVASGLAAYLAARIPVGTVALVGAAAGVPFWAPRPGSGGALNTQQPGGRALGTHALSLLWSVTGFLTTVLDSHLSTHKTLSVQGLDREIRLAFHGSSSQLNRKLASFLKSHASNLTDTDERALRLARLAAAEDQLHPLLGLVYDWKLERALRSVVAAPPHAGADSQY